MLNLDEIQPRIDQGVFSAHDTQSLYSECQSLTLGVNPILAQKVGLGLANAADNRALFEIVEAAYKVAYSRPTAQDRVAADRQASLQAKLDAEAKRQQSEAQKVAQEAKARDDRAALVQQVADSQSTAALQKSALDKFQHDNAVAAQLLADKKKVQDSLQSQLGN